MRAWLVLAAAMVATCLVVCVVEWNGGAQDRALKAQAKEDAAAVSDEVIRRGYPWSVDDDRLGEGMCYSESWSHAADGGTYTAYDARVTVYKSGVREFKLWRAEFPKSMMSWFDEVGLKFDLGHLFQRTYGGGVTRDEYFVDEDTDGVPNSYWGCRRPDGKPFTRRDRDIGDRAGVHTERGGDDAWRRYATVLADARSHLEKKDKK